MSVEVHCIRNFTIDNLYDYSGDWGVKFQGNSEEDWLSTDWTSKTVSVVRKYLDDSQLEIDSYNLLPSFRDLDIEEPMSVIDARWLKESLTEPHKCIEEFNKSDILSKTETTNPKVHNYLKWLYENWSNGFHVILVH